MTGSFSSEIEGDRDRRLRIMSETGLYSKRFADILLEKGIPKYKDAKRSDIKKSWYKDKKPKKPYEHTNFEIAYVDMLTPPSFKIDAYDAYPIRVAESADGPRLTNKKINLIMLRFFCAKFKGYSSKHEILFDFVLYDPNDRSNEIARWCRKLQARNGQSTAPKAQTMVTSLKVKKESSIGIGISAHRLAGGKEKKLLKFLESDFFSNAVSVGVTTFTPVAITPGAVSTITESLIDLFEREDKTWDSTQSRFELHNTDSPMLPRLREGVYLYYQGPEFFDWDNWCMASNGTVVSREIRDRTGRPYRLPLNHIVFHISGS